MNSLSTLSRFAVRELSTTRNVVQSVSRFSALSRCTRESNFAQFRNRRFQVQTTCLRTFTSTRSRLSEHANSSRRAKWSQFSPALSLAAIVALVAGYAVETYEGQQKPVHEKVEDTVTVVQKPGHFRISDVAKHDRDADRKWIVHGTQVYDITDFIEAHPGGEVILRACGGSVDPFWKIFTIHNKPEVEDALKQYCIGEIDPLDIDANNQIRWASLGTGAEIADPFFDDPKRDERLLVHTAKPCNAETPAELLARHFITPIKLFFVRNHLWVPRIDPAKHELTIEFSDGEEATFTLPDLQSKFKEHTITATLQCAGNRRKHMSQSPRGKTSGLQWDVGAISTAEFTGARLCDVLCAAGYDEASADENDDRHIQFTAPDDTYASSIPLTTALARSSDVLLAYKMNGLPMDRDHGGPLRVIVPGTTAARSVKWVGRMTISSEESTSQYQRRDYKCFGPNVKAAQLSSEDWDSAQSIQETPVQSAITRISGDNTAEGSDTVRLEGFAFSGGGRAIVRVDVSSDGGRTWKQAQIQPDEAKGSKRWAWSLWSIQLPKAPDGAEAQTKSEYMVKATDDSYNSQPEGFDAIWNFRGLLANAWHRVAH